MFLYCCKSSFKELNTFLHYDLYKKMFPFETYFHQILTVLLFSFFMTRLQSLWNKKHSVLLITFCEIQSATHTFVFD